MKDSCRSSQNQSSPARIIFSVWRGNDPVGNNEELVIDRSAVTSLFTWENERPSCPDGRFYGEYILSQVRDTSELFGEETSHRLWAYVDGLMEKYHEDRMAGRCSVAANMAYDPEAEEGKVDADISLFRALKASIEGIDDSIPPPDLQEIQQDTAASPGI